MMIFWGHVRDFFAFLFQRGRYIREASGLPSDNLALFAPLLKSWEHFYTRRLYTRVQDAFNRPISSNPGARIDVHWIILIRTDNDKCTCKARILCSLPMEVQLVVASTWDRTIILALEMTG